MFPEPTPHQTRPLLHATVIVKAVCSGGDHGLMLFAYRSEEQKANLLNCIENQVMGMSDSEVDMTLKTRA